MSEKKVSYKLDLFNLKLLTDEQDNELGMPFQKPDSGVDIPPLDEGEKFLKKILNNKLYCPSDFNFDKGLSYELFEAKKRR